MARISKLVIGWILLCLSVVSYAQGDVGAGRSLYTVCAGCHGFEGEGNLEVDAPKLAGQEGWYLTRQIGYYQGGIRGGNPEDVHGARMALMSGALPSERAIEDVIAYIGTLPDAKPARTLPGDPARGQSLYAVCAACHGAGGEGNAGLSAPRLMRMDDWYLAAQLRAYMDGTRGAHPDDAYGRQMVPVVTVVTDDEALMDLIAYISSLD